MAHAAGPFTLSAMVHSRCVPLLPFSAGAARCRRAHPRCLILAASARVPNAELLAVAQRAAEAGAAVVLDRVDKPRSISYKGATDLVTDTDQASEDAVLAVIRGAFPNHAVLGEEGGVFGDTSSEYLWCVDPLDGTTNFVSGRGRGLTISMLDNPILGAPCAQPPEGYN